MVICYIIYSRKIDRFYVGASQESIELRLTKHNQKIYGDKHFTSQTDDWDAFYVIECKDIKQALRIEKHIKRMKSRVYIQNLIKHPGIVKKLLSKYAV